MVVIAPDTGSNGLRHSGRKYGLFTILFIELGDRSFSGWDKAIIRWPRPGRALVGKFPPVFPRQGLILAYF